MNESWHHCPSCDVCFLAVPDKASLISCPDCGKAFNTNGEPVWYYARDKKKIGPLTTAQMKALMGAGTLTAGDMVLRAGAKKWLPAAEVAELAPAVAPTDSVKDTFAIDKPMFDSKHEALSLAQVVPEAANCVQCGMCSYNCPMEIDVRAHAWRGKPIRDSHCLTCAECVNRCPRGVLRFERISLLALKK